MALLTAQLPIITGTVLAPVAAAGGGDNFANTGSEFFYIKNLSGGNITVTFDSPGTCSFGLANNAVHDAAIVVATATERIIGPFPTPRFNDGSNLVQVTYSGVTSTTVAVIKAA